MKHITIIRKRRRRKPSKKKHRLVRLNRCLCLRQRTHTLWVALWLDSIHWCEYVVRVYEWCEWKAYMQPNFVGRKSTKVPNTHTPSHLFRINKLLLRYSYLPRSIIVLIIKIMFVLRWFYMMPKFQIRELDERVSSTWNIFFVFSKK